MRSVEIPLQDRSYPVLIGPGLIGSPSAWKDILGEGPAYVLTNDVVGPLYLDQLYEGLGHSLPVITIPDGEAQKSVDNWRFVLDRLAQDGASRDTTLVALGGGVIGDLAGFVAASWMRGIRFIQVPTTLLAQVDASVGGKTAVNIPQGKNLVGAFHQPAAVIADTASLSTLPDREYNAGLAEVVKYGAIQDRGFIDYLVAHSDDLKARNPDVLDEVVERSVRFKAKVVASDELEQGVRAILNFGHTFGHAIETETAYEQFLHGEAVSIGMVIAAQLSENRGLSEPGFTEQLKTLLETLGLPVAVPRNLGADVLMKHMKLDKKNLAGRRRLILLKTPGEAVIDENSTDGEIRSAIEHCQG